MALIRRHGEIFGHMIIDKIIPMEMSMTRGPKYTNMSLVFSGGAPSEVVAKNM